MTWVKPSNLKLIDRAIRYVRQILVARGERDPGYESVCYSLFELRASLELNESIVLKTVDHISLFTCLVPSTCSLSSPTFSRS